MPGVRERKLSAAPETRAAILAAAEEVFAREGLTGARTDAIAAAAGVNKALLYYYFKSKEQLYEAVIESHFQLLNEQAFAVLTPPAIAEAPRRAREVLLQYVDVHFDFMRAHQRYASLYHHLMFAGGSATEKTMAKVVQKYFMPRAAALQALIARGIREGDFRELDVRHAAVSITALIVFYFSASRVLELLGQQEPYSDANLQKRKQEVAAFIRHGLFTEKP